MSWTDEEMLKDLSAATAATIEQLRAAFALQKLYKRRRLKAARTGKLLDLPVRTDTNG